MSSDRLHILIVGCGGREHAIVKALHKSNFRPRLFCFGTYRNPGILALVDAYATAESITDINSIINFAEESSIDFAIIGPESPLQKGVVDSLDEIGVSCIGPFKSLARIETSKQYTRKLMNKYGMAQFSPKWNYWECKSYPRGVQYDPNTPHNKIMTDAHFQELKSRNFSVIENSITEFISQLHGKYVIKCDGLKGGKGVKVSGDHFKSPEEGIEWCKKLYNNRENFLIEEKLEGEEFSLISFCDGKNFVHCPVVKDYKRAYSKNRGPNTGGMGSVSTKNHMFPFLRDVDIEQARKVNETVIRSLMIENGGTPYIGIVYGGFMKLDIEDVNGHSIRVIEYNARFGDPEGINLLELLETDFVQLCLDMLNERLNQNTVKFKEIDSKCVYVVPKGYPINTVSNFVIDPTLLQNIIRQEDCNVELIISGINHKRNVLKHGANTCPEPIHEGNVYIEQMKTLGSGELTCETVGVRKLESPKVRNVEELEKMREIREMRTVTDIINNEGVELSEIVIDVSTIDINNHKQDNSSSKPQSGLMTTGSRTFALIGLGRRGIRNLEKILEMLQFQEDIVDHFSFRKDIGNDVFESMQPEGTGIKSRSGLYAKSGVNIETGNEAVESIQHYVKKTHTLSVLQNDGGFGGMIKIPEGDNGFPENHPERVPTEWVMINSTDSVGSKSVFVREWWGKTKGMDSLGHDIVNHCVNDILVQSPDVKPWTFLDYFATHTLDPVELKWFVKGVSEACKRAGCVLIGGETAEIPGIYKAGCHDLVGAITGFVDKQKLLTPKQTIADGDIVFGIPSDSPHTNGFTLIQHLVKQSKEDNDFSYLRYVDDWAKSHRCYLKDVQRIRDAGVQIKGLCHITGGGFIDNPKRILPSHLDIRFDWSAIKKQMPDWMRWIVRKMQHIDPDFDMKEVYRTFNCGIGMLVVIAPDQLDTLHPLIDDMELHTTLGMVVSRRNRSV